MKKILVPTDFSDHAQKAYSVAAEIARKNNVPIELFSIHKEHILKYTTYGEYVINDAIKQNLQEGNRVVEKLTEHAKMSVFEGVDVNVYISTNENDDLAVDIYNHLNNGDYSLSVIGTEGKEKKSETFAEIIARHAEIPIITVRKSQTKFEPKKVLLCTDFKNVSPGYLRSLKKLLNGFNAQITILYVNTPSDFKDSEEIERAFKLFSHLYHITGVEFRHYDAYKVSDGITKFLSKNDFDLLSLSTHGRTGLSHIFKGSVSEDFINESDIPVFSYNLHDYNEKMNRRSLSSSASTRGFTG